MNFEMPQVEIGENVHYFVDADRTSTPNAARVVSIDHRSLCVEVTFQATDTNQMTRGVRSEVRHTTDPDIRDNPNVRANGAWDFHPTTKRLRDVEARLATLEHFAAVMTAKKK